MAGTDTCEKEISHMGKNNGYPDLVCEKTGCFTLFVLLVACVCCCSVALPHHALGWSAVCNGGIS